MAFTAAIAFVSLLWQTPTSLEIKGERLEVAAPKIAQALGLPNLTVAHNLRNDVIAMRAIKLTRAEIQEKLCWLVNGTLIERQEGWMLDQTIAQRAEDVKTHEQSRLKQFQKLVDECRKSASKLAPFDEKAARDLQNELVALSKMNNASHNSGFYKKVNASDRKGPLQRVGHQVAARLTAKDWLPLTKDRPIVVYSLNPTNMQLPLPMRVDDLIAAAIEGQNTWALIGGDTELTGPRARTEDGGEEDGSYWLGTTNNNRKQMSASDIKNLVVKLSLENRSISVIAYGREDQAVFESSVSLYEFDNDSTENLTVESYEKRLAKRKPLAPEVKEFLTFLGMERGARPTEPVSETLRQKLLDPEKTDPVSIGSYPILKDAIDDRNFAFLMSDDMIALNFFDFALFSSGRGAEYTIIKDDKWITMREPDILGTREERVDRKKLGQVLRFVDANKRELTIEEKANFFAALPRARTSTYFIDLLISILAPSPVRGNSVDPSGYRIYGSMSTADRANAFKAPIQLAKLSSELHKNLYQELFMELYGSYPQVDYPESGSREEVEAYSKAVSRLYSGLMQEKTFLMPNGLTNEMTVKLTENSEQVLSCVSPDSNRYNNSRTMQPIELGMYLFRKTNPKKYRWEVQTYNAIDEDRIWIASKRDVTVKLQVSQFVSFSWTLSQATITDKKKYTASTLPAEVLKQVREGYKQAEEQDKYYNTGRSGLGGNPPPPQRLLR